MADGDTTAFPRWQLGHIYENDEGIYPPTQQPQFRDFILQSRIYTRQVHLFLTAPSSLEQKMGHSSKVEGINMDFDPEPPTAKKGVTAPFSLTALPRPSLRASVPHATPTKRAKKPHFLDPPGAGCRPGAPCRVLGC